jgi:DhnA family fructose-bisphosphate aldolase class Ia
VADQFSANSAFSEEKKILTTQWLAYSYFCSEFQVRTMKVGKRIRLNRIFSDPSGRLCSVAIDHFIGYGKLTPGDFSPGAKIVYDPESIMWATRVGIECGADVIKVGYTGDVASFRQVVESSPVPLIAAGGPEARNLREALDTMAAVIEAGGLGATIGPNVWGVKPVTEALQAFKAVILNRVSPAMALEVVGLTGSE